LVDLVPLRRNSASILLISISGGSYRIRLLRAG